MAAVQLPPPGSAGKVRIGFFSFTEVTEPGAHRSYNEWHQLDHLPEQLPVPGIAWGQRWVLSPSCRRARAAAGPLLEPVHYLTMYLMTDPVDHTLESFASLAGELHRAGRFHEQRRSHLSGPFDVVSAHAAKRVLVSGAAVPYRPNTGVYVVVEVAGPDDDERWRAPVDPDPLLAVDGVAGVWSFAALPARGHWKPGRHRVTVCYLDGDPVTVARDMAPLVADGAIRAEGTEVVLAAPLETIMPWTWDWFDDEADR